MQSTRTSENTTSSIRGNAGMNPLNLLATMFSKFFQGNKNVNLEWELDQQNDGNVITVWVDSVPEGKLLAQISVRIPTGE